MTLSRALESLALMAHTRHVLKCRRAAHLWAPLLDTHSGDIVRWYAYGLEDGAFFTALRATTKGVETKTP
jgi:hypothetical protein